MNIKTKIAINNIKKKALNGWYFCMKPLANILKYSENKKYKKNSEYLKNLPLDEVARLYVETIVKSMAKRNNPTELYYHCESKGNTRDCYEDNFILGDLNTFGYSRFSKSKLRGWYYTSKFTPKGFDDKAKEEWVLLENKLQELVENEFVKAGCKVEHIDETEKLDEWFIRESKYQYTVVVTA